MGQELDRTTLPFCRQAARSGALSRPSPRAGETGSHVDLPRKVDARRPGLAHRSLGVPAQKGLASV